MHHCDCWHHWKLRSLLCYYKEPRAEHSPYQYAHQECGHRGFGIASDNFPIWCSQRTIHLLAAWWVHMSLYLPTNWRLFWCVRLVNCRHSSRKTSHFGCRCSSTGCQIISGTKTRLFCHLGLFLLRDFAAIGPYFQVLSIARYEAHMPANLARP